MTSKLEELIAKLCPNGVEYKVLGELCNICTGKLNANAKDEDGILSLIHISEPTRRP